ncbi:MAG: aminopeptidase [Bacteroidales bacterium]|jgi:bleomycin hydrolase|nr:aminopeptidase [Bacteroidales bacterium]
MKIKFTIVAAFTLLMGSGAAAQSISNELVEQLRTNYRETPAERAIRNAIGNNEIKKLAVNQENNKPVDDHFSVEVKTKGITDQNSSGRCWLFTGLNVLRAKAISDFDLGSFQFSQSYVFFYDQLEKSNLFLQAIIDTRKLSMDDRKVDWLFSNPLSDGGTFAGVADLVTKYGLVPASVMPESHSANNTSRMAALIKEKLREQAIELRSAAEKGANEKALIAKKEQMLGVIYKMLVINLGMPPKEFTWAQYNSKGELVSNDTYTPLSFAKKFANNPILTDFVMLMNDPAREYYKVYEIEYDRHTYDGHNWLYINLPIEDIKPIAIASLKDSTAMYFSCDVAKQLDSERGLLDLNNYDYASLMGTTFNMDKRQRVLSHQSGSSHAMTLDAVDIDKNGKPTKWRVENSWGASSGHNGYLIMTDEWFNEYMFRLVVEKKYVSEKILNILKQKPTLLPAWDPMFAPEM